MRTENATPQVTRSADVTTEVKVPPILLDLLRERASRDEHVADIADFTDLVAASRARSPSNNEQRGRPAVVDDPPTIQGSLPSEDSDLPAEVAVAVDAAVPPRTLVAGPPRDSVPSGASVEPVRALWKASSSRAYVETAGAIGLLGTIGLLITAFVLLLTQG